jgi:hypothetical protein
MIKTTHNTAAAEIPAVSRRGVLCGLAAATALAATAKPAPTAETSPELERLIAAKRKADTHFNDVLTEVAKIEDAYFDAHKKELFVDLSIGGAQSFHVNGFFHPISDYQSVRADIIKRYEDQHRKLASIAKIAPSVAAEAADALHKAETRDMRTLRQVIRDEIERRKAFGFWQAKEAEDEASQADLDAFTAICAFRCTTVADFARKAEIIAHETRATEIQSGDFQILLASMMDEEGGAA